MRKKERSIEDLSEKLQRIEELKQRIANASKPQADDAAIGHIADLSNTYPLLASVMTAHLEKGGPEEGATVLLWGKEEGLGGILNVKPLGVRAFINAGSLQEWLDEAERLLGDPGHKWDKEKRKRRQGGSYGRSKGRA